VSSGSVSKKVKLPSGVTLNYVEAGDPNGPAVVLIHGYTDSSFSYSRVLPLIDKRYRLFAIDQRGHGDSDKPAGGYAMKDFAADVAAFMDVKGVKSATIVGHSMGSFVAMQTALDSPQKVARLVLIGTASTANNKTIAELSTVIDQMKGPISPDFARDFQVGTSSPDLPAEFINTVVVESLKVPMHVWRSALAGVMARDYKPDLGRIKVPVIIFWGGKETIFPREEQEILKAKLPNASLKIYPNSGHAPHWEEPQRFASDLNEILALK
jgi:pimeloyl-ACP methyl ester carboxylesterase